MVSSEKLVKFEEERNYDYKWYCLVRKWAYSLFPLIEIVSMITFIFFLTWKYVNIRGSGKVQSRADRYKIVLNEFDICVHIQMEMFFLFVFEFFFVNKTIYLMIESM